MIEILKIPDITPTMHQILGITLGLLLVIRTNTAYDRWWEGRRFVGMLTNSTRNLALDLNAFLPKPNTEIRSFFAALISSYYIAMKEHLRSGVKFEELEDLDSATLELIKNSYHVPNHIAQIILFEINKAQERGDINGFQFLALTRRTEDLTDIVGACERIKKTPMPLAYRYHLKFFILIYIATLPIGLIHEIKYWTIPATMIIFYAMVGLEMIGEEIEDPFGTDENDIPMDIICANTRHNIYEILLPEITDTK